MTKKARHGHERISPSLTGISGMLGAASFGAGIIGIIGAGLLAYCFGIWAAATVKKMDHES